jgi:hypothetical protein
VSTTQKQAHAVISYYQKLFKKKYGYAPKINRYVEKWGMIDTIDDNGYEGTMELLDYYFTTGAEGHTLSNFYRTAHLLTASKMDAERDAERRRQILEETKQRVEQES